MKSMKRLISILMVVCMMFTLCSTVSFAATSSLTLNNVSSMITADGTGRKFTVSGTYDGLGEGAGKTLIIGLFKGEIEEHEETEGDVPTITKEFINPVTKAVTYVTTSYDAVKGKHTFTQDFVIPFAPADTYLGHYMVMVNCAEENTPQYKIFEMTAAQSTATMTKAAIYNASEDKEYDALVIENQETGNKEAAISGVPFNVSLDNVTLYIYTDAFSIKIGETTYDRANDYDVKNGRYVIEGFDCTNYLDETGDNASFDVKQFAEDESEQPLVTVTIAKNPAKETAELNNVKVAFKYKGDEDNWRGFDAQLGDDGVWHVDVESSALDFNEMVITYTTDAVAVKYNGEEVVKYTESEDPTKMDASGEDKKVTLTLTAENTKFTYPCVIDVDTTAVALKNIKLKKVGKETFELDERQTTFNKKAKNTSGLSGWVLEYEAYDDKKLMEGENEIISNTTLLDFTETSTKTFTLSPDKGEPVTYKVTLTIDPASVAKLYSITIGGKVATIDGTTIKVKLPGDRSIAKTNFVYSINSEDGAVLKFSKNGTSDWQTAEWLKAQIADNKTNNLTNYKYLQVVSKDGSEKTEVYTLQIDQEAAPEKDSTVTQRPDDDASGDSFVVVDRPVVEPSTPEKEINFTDLGTAEWARESIMNLAKRGVISGRSDSIFDPDGLVTREEYAKILVLAFGLTAEGAECDKFWDVSPTDWYYEYVAIASARGIVNGLDNGSFGVGSTITRQDMAVMTYRAAMATGKAFSYTNEPMTFNDAGNIATYAQEAVTVMQRAGIINGMGGDLFAPNGTATRAQAAKIMDMATK